MSHPSWTISCVFTSSMPVRLGYGKTVSRFAVKKKKASISHCSRLVTAGCREFQVVDDDTRTPTNTPSLRLSYIFLLSNTTMIFDVKPYTAYTQIRVTRSFATLSLSHSEIFSLRNTRVPRSAFLWTNHHGKYFLSRYWCIPMHGNNEGKRNARIVCILTACIYQCTWFE